MPVFLVPVRLIILAAIAAMAFMPIATYGQRSKAPVDKPKTIYNSAQDRAMEEAIAPYVAKARKTYPAAKKRFLAGLPPNYLFTVWLPFYETDKKTGRHRREHMFVIVDKIGGGTVYGRLNNRPLSLKTYRLGQRLQFAESRVLNWAIIRPDGSEEGNYVGNFLDHWSPPRR